MIARVLLLGVLVVTASFFSSCGTSTTGSRQMIEQSKLEGDVGGVPFRATAVREQRERTESETTVNAPEAANALSLGASLLTGGTGLGIAGLAIGALMWWKKRQSDQALGQTVRALDVVREEVGEETWKPIRAALKSEQDHATKVQIHKLQTPSKTTGGG